MFIKISNNFGILLTVHKYIELKGLNMDLKHHTIHIYRKTEVVDGQFGGAYSLNKFSIRVL